MVRLELDSLPEPHEALAGLGQSGPAFLIESNVVDGARRESFSIAGLDAAAPPAEIVGAGLSDLPARAAGYALERRASDALGVPVRRFMTFGTMIAWDHLRGQVCVEAHGPAAEEAAGRLVAALSPPAPLPEGLPRPSSPLRADMGRGDFIDAVARAVESGRSRMYSRFEVRLAEDPQTVYLRYRKTLGDPVTAWFGGEEGDVLAGSPGPGVSPPDDFTPAFAVRGRERRGWSFPIHRTLTHRGGVYRFEVDVPIGPTTVPAEAYIESLVRARPLAAVLGFRL